MNKMLISRQRPGSHSRTSRFSRIRSATALVLAASAAALLLPGSAGAQTYVGNAYTTKANLNTFLDLDLGIFNTTTATVGANATLFDTGLLNAAGQNLSGVGADALLNLSLATSSDLGGVGLGNVVDTTVSTTRTDSRPASLPAGIAVQSTASVTSLRLGSSTSLIGLLLSNSLINATAVQSQTSAFLSGNAFGSTTLTNFSLNGLTAAQLGIVGTVDINGNLVVTEQQTIKVYDNFLLTGVGQGTQIGTLTINELLPDSVAQGALTTNALHLRLNSNLGLLDDLLGNLAGADVIVSSSTAGFTPAASVAAPEPGSLALLMPLLGGVAVAIRRRRK